MLLYNPKNTTTQSLVNQACNGISLSVTVDSESATTTTVNSISSHSLGTSAAEQVTVVISYADGSAIADGDFEVAFPDIELTYDSVD